MAALLEPFVWMLGIIINMYMTLVVADIALYWLVNFKIVDASNLYVIKIKELLERVTQPVYQKISEKIPPFSGFDFSPFILILLLMFIGRFVSRLDVMLLSY